jgi:hypothetical protein
MHTLGPLGKGVILAILSFVFAVAFATSLLLVVGNIYGLIHPCVGMECVGGGWILLGFFIYVVPSGAVILSIPIFRVLRREDKAANILAFGGAIALCFAIYMFLHG